MVSAFSFVYKQTSIRSERSRSQTTTKTFARCTWTILLDCVFHNISSGRACVCVCVCCSACCVLRIITFLRRNRCFFPRNYSLLLLLSRESFYLYRLPSLFIVMLCYLFRSFRSINVSEVR